MSGEHGRPLGASAVLSSLALAALAPQALGAAGPRLPPGCVARLGSPVMRHSTAVARMVATGDGIHLASVEAGPLWRRALVDGIPSLEEVARAPEVHFWDVRTGHAVRSWQVQEKGLLFLDGRGR